MVIVALISIVCSFVFVSKIYLRFDENSLESIDESNASAVSDAKEEPQQNADIKPENKKDETNKRKETNAEKSNNNDIDNDKEPDSELSRFLVPFESIVVNLGGADSRRYLRVQINLETSSESAQKKINEMMVILRDKMISILSIKTSKELKTESNLFKLRLEIKNILNDLLGSGNIIKKVYFSDFIIQ